jgi:hypothetical protein
MINTTDSNPKTTSDAQIDAANAKPQCRLFIAISPP